MRMIFCCTCFDRLMCFCASRQRKPLIAFQFVLHGIVVLMLMLVLILSSSDSYDVVTSFPRCHTKHYIT